MKNLKRYFLTGFVVVGPVFLSIYVLVVVFLFMDNILGQYLNAHLKKSIGFYVPGLGILISAGIVLLVGFLASRFVGRKVFPYLEKQFSSLPLIRNIYPAFKQIISFVLEQKEFGFKKVVLVEYPSKGMWSLGFLTNEQFESINKATGRESVAVFVPSSPGPLTGYVIFFPKEEVKFLDMPVAEALKIIISGGVFKSENPQELEEKAG